MSHRVLIGGTRVTAMHQTRPKTSLKRVIENQVVTSKFWCYNFNSINTDIASTSLSYCAHWVAIKVSAPGLQEEEKEEQQTANKGDATFPKANR